MRVLINDTHERMAVNAALAGARQWLADEQCRAVLTDFRAQDGLTLDQKLAAVGATPEGYLRYILFTDGDGLGRCEGGSALAVTAPGARVVFVCGREFKRQWALNSRRAQATIVHEALHSLGLGEDPPTSAEITRQVLRRCRP
jgi:hypothetical protein